jgi:hypothetical protein
MAGNVAACMATLSPNFGAIDFCCCRHARIALLSLVRRDRTSFWVVSRLCSVLASIAARSFLLKIFQCKLMAETKDKVTGRPEF